MRKVLFTLVSIMLVAAAAAIYIITFRLDSIVETRIEKAASMAFGSRVEVGGVKTDLRAGTLTVEQISVANPPGFESPYAARLNAVQATVDYKGLEIKSVEIENPEFYIEEKGGKTNFEQMMRALDSEPAQAPDETPAKEPEIVIRHLRIDETRAAFESHTFDQYTDLQVDAIEMNNLRGTPTQLAEQIARELVGQLSSEAAAALVKAKGRKQLDKVQKKVDDKLRELIGGNGDSGN